jgi:chromosome segregation ATPase
MINDDKILKALEDVKDSQKDLKTDVKSIKDVQQKQGKDISTLNSEFAQQRNLLNGIAANMATILEEQQAQRMDIRSLHTNMASLHEEVHASKEELKAEIRAARDEAKQDNIDLKATVVKKIQSVDRRVTNIEEHEGIENPDKN